MTLSPSGNEAAHKRTYLLFQWRRSSKPNVQKYEWSFSYSTKESFKALNEQLALMGKVARWSFPWNFHPFVAVIWQTFVISDFTLSEFWTRTTNRRCTLMAAIALTCSRRHQWPRRSLIFSLKWKVWEKWSVTPSRKQPLGGSELLACTWTYRLTEQLTDWLFNLTTLRLTEWLMDCRRGSSGEIPDLSKPKILSSQESKPRTPLWAGKAGLDQRDWGRGQGWIFIGDIRETFQRKLFLKTKPRNTKNVDWRFVCSFISPSMFLPKPDDEDGLRMHNYADDARLFMSQNQKIHCKKNIQEKRKKGGNKRKRYLSSRSSSLRHFGLRLFNVCSFDVWKC